MRLVKRMDLEPAVRRALAKRQGRVNEAKTKGKLDVEKEWSSGRKTKPLLAVVQTLKNMMGDRERCMYCHDSHGTDIEHFWPKTTFPERMYLWLNMLLCCTECGRFKGNLFPMRNGVPLLIDPTVDQPWDFLDFDPFTGNIVARYDTTLNAFRLEGEKTVEILHLDRREALAAGYQKSYRRLIVKIQDYLTNPTSPHDFVDSLRETDDHGLLGWCFLGNGQHEPLFIQLRRAHPNAWDACVLAFS